MMGGLADTPGSTNVNDEDYRVAIHGLDALTDDGAAVLTPAEQGRAAELTAVIWGRLLPLLDDLDAAIKRRDARTSGQHGIS